MIRVVNRAGIPFNVRLVRIGDTYGRNGCLTHGEDRNTNADSPPLVEFYDARFMHTPPYGQFVSRYCFDTFAAAATSGRGITLDGGNQDTWFVTAQNVLIAYKRLRGEVRYEKWRKAEDTADVLKALDNPETLKAIKAMLGGNQ